MTTTLLLKRISANLPSATAAALVLCAIALGGTGCTPTGEGNLEVRVPDYFSLGYTNYGDAVRSPGAGTHLVRLELIHQTAEMNYAQITFEGFATTHLLPVFETHCQNLSASLYRCVGKGMEDPAHSPSRFVSLIDGRNIVGFQIWELRRSPAYMYLDAAPAGQGPHLVATFGRGSDFLPPN